MSRSWPGIVLVTLVFSLPMLNGCANRPLASWWGKKDAYGLKQAHAQTHDTMEFITRQAAAYHVPEKHVAEARVGMTEIEVNLDNARVAELEREAHRRERISKVRSNRQQAESHEQIRLAVIEELKSQQNTRLTKLQADLSARTRSLKAQAEKNDQLRDALGKESNTKQDNLISEGEKAYADSKAEIEQLRVERKEVEKERTASIDELKEQVRAIRARAAANVASLRTEAQTVVEQTAARDASLKAELKAIPVKIQAVANQLLTQADSIESDSQVIAAEFNAQADEFEKQEAQQEFDLNMTVAKSERDKAQANFEDSTSEINFQHDQAMAEVERLRAAAQMTIEKAHSQYKEHFSELTGWYKRTKVETVDSLLNEADQKEKLARSAFVKAEAMARSKAMQATAQHLEALSEAQMKTLTAAAQAEAAQMRLEIQEQLKKQFKAGRVDFKGNTDLAPEPPLDLHSLPQVPVVADVTPRVEPEHIAAYRTALAQVAHMRNQADARLHLLDATFGERKSALQAVQDQNIATGNEQFANADNLKKQAEAKRTEAAAAITAQLAIAKTQYNRSIAEAESFRKEALSKAMSLRAKARATITHGTAQALALRKEADVVSDSEESEVASLRATLQSNHEQGQSKNKQLLAQASSLEEREGVHVDQVVAQIKAAERSMVAELGNLDQLVETKVAVADANYKQALGKSEAIARKTEVQLKRLEARDELQFALAQAEIERTRDQLFMTRIKGSAEVDRRLAQAQAERAEAEALNDAEMIAIRTDAELVTARVTAQRRVAQAREKAVKSLFRARVEESIANSLRQKTSKFLDGSFRRSNIERALARSRAARDATKRRLAALKRQNKTFRRAAAKDWDPRLARTRGKAKMVSDHR